MENKINFQKELQHLSEIVEKVDNPNTSIDDSLSLYQEGLKIIEKLEKALKEAETKIEKIIEK